MGCHNSSSLRAEYLHKLFEIHLHRIFVYSLFILYPIIYIYIYISIESLIFILFWVIWFNLYLFYCSNCYSLATGNSLSSLLCLLDISQSMCCGFFCCCFLTLPYFLLLKEAIGSCIFTTPVLESPISLKNPGSLLLENGIRKQDLSTRRTRRYCSVVVFV